MVVLVEVSRKPYLASIVPVIVNAILNEHQIIVDIVAFVNKGDFPRSRLGEKQRGKILAGWVTRKLRTLAQFAIRDLDPAAMGETGGAGAEGGGDPNRISTGSIRSGAPAAGASSLRNVEHAPQILEQEEFEQQMDHIANMTPVQTHDSIGEEHMPTPTAYPQSHAAGGEPYHARSTSGDDGYFGGHQYGGDEQGEAPPPVGPKPARPPSEGHAPPKIRLPGVDGREGFDLWSGDDKGDEEDWTTNAIMHMNLAGDMNPRQGQGH